MSIVGSLFPLIGWLFYNFVVGRIERDRPSLSLIMSEHRRRWVANALTRNSPVDAILTTNLMASISFFASTTVLLIIALLTIYGQFDAIVAALSGVRIGPLPGPYELEAQVLSMLVLLTAGFFAFTLSLRQFNHFCILIGAARHGCDDQTEIVAIAAVNTIAARNFNQGIRAYYFIIADVAWFWSPYAAIVVTLVIAGMLMYREFYSPARSLVANLDGASRAKRNVAGGEIRRLQEDGYHAEDNRRADLRSREKIRRGNHEKEDRSERSQVVRSDLAPHRAGSAVMAGWCVAEWFGGDQFWFLLTLAVFAYLVWRLFIAFPSAAEILEFEAEQKRDAEKKLARQKAELEEAEPGQNDAP